MPVTPPNICTVTNTSSGANTAATTSVNAASRVSIVRSRASLLNQYGFAIGRSSAGYSVMIFAPFGVSTTSSSMRAADIPSVAGQ